MGHVSRPRPLIFTLARGEIVSLFGPDGTGKTTTLSILSGVIRPDCGGARIGGHDLFTEGATARGNLELAPQALALYPSLTARENLVFFAGWRG
jgi:ABC-2 type transport system ATP-binding protein